MTFTKTIATLFFEYLLINLFNTFSTFTLTCRNLLSNLIFDWSTRRMLKRLFNVLSNGLFYSSRRWSNRFSDRLTNRFFYYIRISRWWLSYDRLSDYGLFYYWFISSRKFFKGFITIVVKLLIYFFRNLRVLRFFDFFLILLRLRFLSGCRCCVSHHLL